VSSLIYKPAESMPINVGIKAHRLARLAMAGYRVPEFRVLAPQALLSTIDASDKAKAAVERYRTSFLNKLDVVGSGSAVAKAIGEAPIPSEVSDALSQIFHELPKPLIVRSSGSLEDDPATNLAGAFVSIPGVETEAALTAAVRSCWTSLYGLPLLMRLSESGDDIDGGVLDLSAMEMALVIQVYREPQLGGVAFTVDPLGRAPGHHVIEASRFASGVQDGSSESAGALVARSEGRGSIVDNRTTMGDAEVLALSDTAAKIEKLFGGVPQDIEWVDAGDGPHIVQSRDISPIAVAESVCHVGATAELVEHGRVPDGFQLGECQGIHRSYSYKKDRLRRLAASLGVKVPAWYWLHCNAAGLDSRFRDMLAGLGESPFVQIDLSTSLRAIVREWSDVPEVVHNVAAARAGSCVTVHLRDAIPTEVAAISSVDDMGNVVIEYVEGALQALRSGSVEASRVRATVDGRILDSLSAHQEWIEVFDMESRRLERKPLGRRVSPMRPEHVREIAAHTAAVVDSWPELRPEWWIWNDSVYLADGTVENARAHEWGAVVSPGEAEGILVRITSDELPSELSNGYAISADSLNDRIYATGFLEEIRRKRPWLPESGWIVAAERPLTELALLLPWVGGFAFQSAATLSHLAITLRAQGIPAVAGIDLARLQEGSKVRITDSGTLEVH
jgi:hypothetical protein